MKQYEIDYSAPAAVVKTRLTDKYAIANVYKVKRYASFVIHFVGKENIIYCGTPEQVVDFVRKENLNLIPKNARARKYLPYFIPVTPEN